MKNEIEITSSIKDANYKKIINKLYRPLYNLNNMFLKSKEKVSYYYEDLNTGTVLSFNANRTFYAASTIKVLVCIYLYELSIKDKQILEKEIEYTEDVRKDGSPAMESMELGTKHKIKDLIEYTITVSDNSAYKMLMNDAGVETIKEYGQKLGATTTMEGKDHYGIVNATDFVIYLKYLLRLAKDHKIMNIILEHMKNNKFKKIDVQNLGNNVMANKGGTWDIAYHECAIVYDKEPFILCIFTQKGTLKNKQQFINKATKQIYQIHTKINHYIKNY